MVAQRDHVLIENEFVVAAPVDRVWTQLIDLEQVALCLPGAEVTGRAGDDYQGRVKIRIGPITPQFTGTVRFATLDDTGRNAVLEASGRDTRGGGNAQATITTSVSQQGDSTLVRVVTDLRVMGRLAQFGAGVLRQVATRLVDDFVVLLEAQLAGDADAPAAAAAGLGPEPLPPAPPGDALDLGKAVLPPATVVRAVAAGVAVGLVVFVAVRIRRRRGE